MIINQLLRRQKAIASNFVQYFILSHFIPYEPRQYVLMRDLKLAYLNIPKAACSSIKWSLLDKARPEISAKYKNNPHAYPWEIVNSRNDLPEGFVTFSFVRNPLERLVSCYKNKFEEWSIGRQRFEFDEYLFGVFYQSMTFPEFVRALVAVPDRMADGHFRKQTSLCFDGNICAVDHLWKLEDAAEFASEIGQITSISEIPNLNSSANREWRQYYDDETLKLVQEYYRDDFVLLGYDFS